MKDERILVFYLNTSNINDDIEKYKMLDNIKNMCDLHFPYLKYIIVPNDGPTRIECINPKYITEKKLIDEHNMLMDNLNRELRLLTNHKYNE